MAFNSQWEDSYFCVLSNGKSQCLICHASISVKSSTVRRHYENKHAATHETIAGEARKDLIARLKAELPQSEEVKYLKF